MSSSKGTEVLSEAEQTRSLGVNSRLGLKLPKLLLPHLQNEAENGCPQGCSEELHTQHTAHWLAKNRPSAERSRSSAENQGYIAVGYLGFEKRDSI